MATDKPVGMNCPGCGAVPGMALGSDQVMCVTPECKIMFWNPSSTMDELLDNVQWINHLPKETTSDD